MPTTVTAYVNTASSGGDGTTNNTSGGTAAYASLNACIAARAKNLVTADEILLVKCTGSSADTTAVAVGSWASFVCDTDHYVQIEPNAGQEHGGAWNTGVYRLETTDTSGITIPNTTGAAFFIKIYGLQVRAIATTGSTNRRAIGDTGGITVASGLDVLNCILRVSKTGGTATSHDGIVMVDAQWTVKVGNCLVLLDGSSVGDGINRAGISSMYVHNCGVAGATTAYIDSINSATGTFQLKNNWAKGCTTFSSGTGVENSDYNSTDLGTATGGANDRVSQTFTFVDEGNGDYRPASADTAIKGQGVDLSADGNLAITTDMIGNSVNSPPEIGPLNAESSEEGPTETRWRIYRAAA